MLTDHDIDRIASAVVRKLKATEEMKLDAEFAVQDFDAWREQQKVKSRNAGRKKR